MSKIHGCAHFDPTQFDALKELKDLKPKKEDKKVPSAPKQPSLDNLKDLFKSATEGAKKPAKNHIHLCKHTPGENVGINQCKFTPGEPVEIQKCAHFPDKFKPGMGDDPFGPPNVLQCKADIPDNPFKPSPGNGIFNCKNEIPPFPDGFKPGMEDDPFGPPTPNPRDPFAPIDPGHNAIPDNPFKPSPGNGIYNCKADHPPFPKELMEDDPFGPPSDFPDKFKPGMGDDPFGPIDPGHNILPKQPGIHACKFEPTPFPDQFKPGMNDNKKFEV